MLVRVFLNRHRHLTAVVLLVLALAAIWFFESSGARSWRVEFWQWASLVHDGLSEAPPMVYFTAAGLLPMLGIPIISFYLLTASLYAPEVAILGTAYSVLLNLLLSYAVGHLGRRWITRLIARSGRSIPQIAPRHHIWMTAAIRVTPGAPLMVQNYLLVLAGVPLSVFLLVSLPMEMLIAAGYVLLGHSLFTGNWHLLALAAVLVVGAVLVFRLVRSRTAKKEAELGLAPVATVPEGLGGESAAPCCGGDAPATPKDSSAVEGERVADADRCRSAGDKKPPARNSG